MSYFRCPCGFIAQIEPQHQGEIVSVYHLHTQTHVESPGRVGRMEPLPDAVPEKELVAAGPHAGKRSIEAKSRA